MKKLFTILAALLFTATVWAQSPDKMSYQAVIRNNSNQLITNTLVGMKISIMQGLPPAYTAVYWEIQTPYTNANGLVSLSIGGPNTGFDTIHWDDGPYFIKTETDPNGGTNYSITGESQLLSVPYALHATTADSITGTLHETDPVFSTSPAAGITGINITNWNNSMLPPGAFGNTLYHNGTSWMTNDNIYNDGNDVGIGNPYSLGLAKFVVESSNKTVIEGDYTGTSANSAIFGSVKSYAAGSGLGSTQLCSGIKGITFRANPYCFGVVGYQHNSYGNGGPYGGILGALSPWFSDQPVVWGALAYYDVSGKYWGAYINGKTKTTDSLTVGDYTLPNTDGTLGQVLITNGAGKLSWQTISASIETDPVFTASPAAGITSSNITNWNNNMLPSGSSGQTLRHNGTSWVANNNLFNNGSGVGIGTTSPTQKLDVNGNINAAGNLIAAGINTSGQINSTVPTGTAPINVTSTTKASNLNADMVDGYHLTGTPVQVRAGGIVTGGNYVDIDIPSYYPFELQLSSGHPYAYTAISGGQATIQGFVNDSKVGLLITYSNGANYTGAPGTGTVSTTYKTCDLGSVVDLFTFGGTSGNLYTVSAMGTSLKLRIRTNSGAIEVYYKLTY